MAQEIYHRSEWGNPNEQWGNVYLNADLTNELYKRASEYENSWVTDQLLNGVGTKPSIILTPTAYEDGVLNSVKPAKTFGSELVTNGDFATDSDWTKQTGWSISGGKANRSGVSSNNYIGQDFNIEQGKKYIVKYNRTYISGNGETSLYSYFNSNTTRTTKALYNSTVQETVTVTDTFVPNFSGNLALRAYGIGDFTGSIDNVSVKEVTEADFDFTRGSSATRVNELGLVQDVQLLSGELVQNGNFEQIGSELITNGDFATDSDWNNNVGNDWQIVNGKLILTTTSYNNINQSIGLVQNKFYKIVFTIANTTLGGVRVRLGTGTITSEFTNGTHTIYLEQTTANAAFRFYASSSGVFDGEIDNVSVKEVGQNWDFGTGWSMGDGKVVKTSGTASALAQTVPTTTIGKKYKFTFDTIVTGGAANATLYGVTIPVFSTSGSQEHIIISTSTTGFQFFGTNLFEGSIDNISVVEVTDDTDLPRINYTNFDYENGVAVPYSGEGSLLLEPQSTNLITYSEDFSQWLSIGSSIIESGYLAPNGNLDATKVTVGSNSTPLRKGTSNILNTEHTFTIYAKKGNYNQLSLDIGDETAATFTLTDKWQRFEVTSTPTTYNLVDITLPSSSSGDFIYIWAAQLEQGYATSYIPTNGEVNGVTRLADVCNNSGSSDLFNDSEGVLMFEGGSLSELDVTARYIQISDGTSTPNGIQFRYYTSTNLFQALYYTNSAYQAILSYTLPNSSENNKIAFKYKENDFALWVNGIEVATDLNGITGASLSKLKFDYNTFSNFYGNVKSVAVFKEALSDTELQKLTT